jgi:NAD(P)-dependent dehydrogenase (short-subunit alcohol dehydrogenase family)
MDGGIAGRVVVITGASRGVGAAAAELFAKQGAAVGLIARDAVALAALAERLPARTAAVDCDVADEDALVSAFDRIAGELGRVDSVVVNAGISPAAHRAHRLSTTDWREVLEVNLTGGFLTARAAYPHLAASGRGRLVLTSSVMARAPRRGLAAYAASKSGLEGLARALAVDWADDRIRVNAVAPGFLCAGLGTAFAESDRLREQVVGKTALGRFGDAAELVSALLFLAGDGSEYLTGHVLAVDGGYGLG